jgi:hypothetical protein
MEWLARPQGGAIHAGSFAGSGAETSKAPAASLLSFSSFLADFWEHVLAGDRRHPDPQLGS